MIPLLLTVAGVLLFAAGYVVGRTGGGEVDLQSAPNYTAIAMQPALEAFPAWSPDGRRIAYAAEVDGTFQIFTKDLEGGEIRQVTTGEADSVFPAWGPEGNRVYYIMRAGQQSSFWVSGETGTEPELVVPDVLQAAVSRDGGSLGLIRRAGNGLRVLLAPPGDPSGGETVAELPGSTIAHLRFARDGKQLAVWADGGAGTSELWLIPTEGGRPRRVLTGAGLEPLPQPFDWTADSDGLVLPWRSHLWRFDIASDEKEPITTGTGRETAPAVSTTGDVLFMAVTGSEMPFTHELPRLDQPPGNAQPAWVAKPDPSGGVELTSVDGSSVKQAGSGNWLSLAWAKGGSVLLGVKRGEDGALSLASLDPATAEERAIADVPAEPVWVRFANLTGQSPLTRLTAVERTVKTGLHRPSSDIWMIQR